MTLGEIYTIGYGEHTTSEFIAQLRDGDIQFVIDVRSVPYSRYQPEFSRPTLQRLLADNGLKYVFMGDQLGGRPRDMDCYTEGRVDYPKCRTKIFFVRGLDRLRNAYEGGFRVCLLCSEGKPWQCHRSKLIGAALNEQGIPVTHILPDGTKQNQQEVMKKVTRGQMNLPGDHLLSRKSYLKRDE